MKIAKQENKTDRRGTPWTKNEIVLALDLYCRMPFGSISASNPQIQELADFLKRSPASVAMKMCNLARFDPTLQVRNVQGLTNGSKLDKEIFDRYFTHMDELAVEAYKVRQRLPNSSPIYVDDPQEIGYDTVREIRQRVGQAFFRSAVLNAYNNRCCVTGITHPKLLIASHIKPWRACDNGNERVNPQNGLCLNAIHDHAFDAGLITINKEGIIIFSKEAASIEMDENTRNWFMYTKGKCINLPEKFGPSPAFIEYHNDQIFIGNAI